MSKKCWTNAEIRPMRDDHPTPSKTHESKKGRLCGPLAWRRASARRRGTPPEDVLAARRGDPRRLAALLPALVVGFEDLRHREVIRVDLKAEFGPLALREAHSGRGLAPIDLVIERGAALGDVGEVARVIDLGLQVLDHLDDVALLVVVCSQAYDRAEQHV